MFDECVKLALFLVSGFGYWEYFRSKHNIHVYFAPVFTIAVQFSVLFFAGLFNCLKEAMVLLHGIGFWLFFRAAVQRRFQIIVPYKNAGYLWLALAFPMICLAVRNQMFTQIDNFTHWATVVRNMFLTDRFPSFKETAVEFTSYPLGSSAMIYFICKMIGETEPMQMCAQAYLMLSALLPLWACCENNKGIYLAVTAVMTGFLLNYNIPVTELLVDTLMPLAGMATVLFVYRHYSDQEERTAISPYYVVPLMIWTMNIKIAALIFVAFAAVVLYLCIRNQAHGRKQWVLIAGTVLFVNLLWSRHCDYVFAGASSSRHTMSFGWFRTILADKDRAGIVDTIKMALSEAVTRTEGIWLAVWLLVLGMLVWFILREEKKRYKMLFFSSVFLYCVYVICVIVMYVVSMEDYGELLAFTRYMRSVDIAIYYMLTAFSGLLLTKIGRKQCTAAVGMMLILLTAAGWRFQTGKYLKEVLARCSVEWRQELEYPIEKYRIQPGKKYLLCIPEDYHGWPRRIWRYRLGTGAVDDIVITEESQLEIAKKYDYVVFFDVGNPAIEAWVQANHPESAGSKVIERPS